MKGPLKELYWVGPARKELGSLPDEVVDVFGYALHLAQGGMKHYQAKPLKGMGGVLEVVEDFKGDTYRAVYTARLGNVVYVLHCFQKKSKRGIKTPRPDMEIIRSRLKEAKEHAQGASNA
jgi:phage-related protein